MSSCQINVEIDYKKVIPLDKQEIPPIIVASYDIECDSSHGDFPIAIKDYLKLAREIVNEYELLDFTISNLNISNSRFLNKFALFALNIPFLANSIHIKSVLFNNNTCEDVFYNLN